MNILFVAACEFASNSALHILSTARVMQARGIECAVSFRSDDNNVRPRGCWPYRVCDHRETIHNGVLFPDGRGPDLIHAWTPREHVRRVTESVVRRHGCPYIVHLEDNEEVILADTLDGFSYAALSKLPARVIDEAISPYLSHPKRYRWFLEGAAGVTALIDKLLEFKPASIPGVVFWPGFEEGILTARAKREDYDLTDREIVMVYNGNVHLSNEAEVSSLIDAVGLLKARGVPVILLKTGANHAAHAKLKEGREKGFLIDLGFVSRQEIHALLNLADVLVQPGHESPFNDYRFPCKLPEFLATGKPVVMPKANLGRYLRNGKECLLMDMGDAEEIAAKVDLLLKDRKLGARIGHEGWKFAIERLNWERNLAPVAKLYEQLAGAASRNGNHGAPRMHHDPLPVALEKTAGNGQRFEEPYLAAAVRGVAVGNLRVEQREDGDPWMYEKWLAAPVERAMRLGGMPIEIAGWQDREEWLAATHRGYAAGLGNYLRDAGLRISDLALERALEGQLRGEPAPKTTRPKTATWLTDAEIEKLISLYSGRYRVPPIGYATVRDYCDSADHMRCVATLHGDLKNVQRPWTVKAILGMVPRGSRLLEIGAGEPWIADILSRAGYEVWIADPYDGSGNGPTELEQFMEECPNVRFLRDFFGDQLLDVPAAMFDCIYSVSVLEHIDDDGLLAMGRGMKRFLKPDGVSLHAIDHVQRGMGQREDLQRLELLSRMFGIEDVELRSTLQRLDRDLDVYTLSAEAFNYWRGQRPYDEFRMRKWVSIQLLTDAPSVARSLPAVARP
jgi:glycosyltransferase involved in cell wall biosynthesis/SAM-dependent methyltransferase